jgi:hypothetical protein
MSIPNQKTIEMHLTDDGNVGCFGANRVQVYVTLTKDSAVSLLQLPQGVFVALSLLNTSSDERTLTLSATNPEGAPYEIRNTQVEGAAFRVPGSGHVSTAQRYVGTPIGNVLQLAAVQ